MTFGEVLKKARTRNKLSRKIASERSGVNAQYIYEIEKNEKNPSLDIIKKLSEAYRDPTLITEFMVYNNITDVQIDVSLSAEKERIFEELSRQDPDNKISRTLFGILKNDDSALEEWTKIVNAFIDKHKKPNGDKSE